MKVGVLQFFSWPGRHGPLEDVYARALERIEIMDRGGFDAVWLAEHHFTTFSVCPSVHMLGTLAAARTRRLRIGTAVSLAALYHPLRLAEEVALLDMLSGGRVNWGAGPRLCPFRVQGLRRAAAGKRRALSRGRRHRARRPGRKERLTYKGAHFRFDDVEVLPKPLQRPHPPVWMAATSEAAIDWAAGRGFSILMDPHASIRELGDKRRRYAREARRRRPLRRGPRHSHGAADRAGADARRGRGGRPARRAMAGRRLCRPAARAAQDDARTYDGKDPVQHYVDSVILHGTPASVVDRSADSKEEIGLNYLMCAPLSRQTFHLLADQVLPRL